MLFLIEDFRFLKEILQMPPAGLGAFFNQFVKIENVITIYQLEFFL